ncbi:hypothetical protein GCM10027072_48130 [Streptomyces bullii]
MVPWGTERSRRGPGVLVKAGRSRRSSECGLGACVSRCSVRCGPTVAGLGAAVTRAPIARILVNAQYFLKRMCEGLGEAERGTDRRGTDTDGERDGRCRARPFP